MKEAAGNTISCFTHKFLIQRRGGHLMKRAILVFLGMGAIAALSLCNCASAEIIGVGPVDYQYHAAGLNGTWTEVSDPGYGPPEWYMLPPYVSQDQWIYVPNLERLDMVKELWLEVQYEPGSPAPTNNPVVWAAQGFTVAGGTNPAFYPDSNTYVWAWTITPQPGSEIFDFAPSFSWAGVTGIDIASKCVPEPSTLVGLVTCGLLGLVLAWRRRKAA
jgi:hypothetical protein